MLAPWQWFERYKAAWFNAKGRQYAGSESDAKACGNLADMLRDLSDFERTVATEGADVMIGLFLADTTPRVLNAGHRFSWFVQDFNVLRLKADDMRRDEIARRRGAKRSPGQSPLELLTPDRKAGPPQDVRAGFADLRAKLRADAAGDHETPEGKIVEPSAS